MDNSIDALHQKGGFKMAEMLHEEHKNEVMHVHGRQSVNDGTCENKEIFAWADKNGSTAICLTDHGTQTGIPPFLAQGEEYLASHPSAKFKLVVGVEAYVQEDADEINVQPPKAHAVLYAKDSIGYHAISKATTLANKRIDSYGAPRMNREILLSQFGPGTKGHGHVVMTTACMQGYVNVVINRKFAYQKEIDRAKAKQAKYKDPMDSEYETVVNRFTEVEELIAEKRAEKATLDKLAKRTFGKREKTVKAAEGTEEYAALKAAFDADKKESEEAAAKKKVVDSEISKLSKEKTELNSKKKDLEKSIDKWIELDEEIQKLDTLISGSTTVRDDAKEALLELVSIFGEGNVFAEMQYHGIPEEAYCMPILAEIAKECNVPLCAANDAHMVTNDEKSRRKRQMLRSLRFNKFEKEMVGDDQLYMKTDDELREWLGKILDEETVDAAMRGTIEAFKMCNYKPEKKDHYPKFQSEVIGETANGAIKRIAEANIEWRYPKRKGWTKEHQARLEYELGIICSMGYADYHLIVADFLNIGRQMGHMPAERFQYLTDHINEMDLDTMLKYIREDQSEVGLFIGPGRGSAVGSLVCYLLGITSIDPLKYDLLFERFLNPERVSMPDIDSDFASECRGLVLEYVKKKYGENAVCCIMTKGTQACKGSIRNCARILGSEMYDDTRAFLSLGDQIAKEVPNAVGTSFNKKIKFYYEGKSYDSVDELNDANKTDFDEKHLPEEVTFKTIIDGLREKFADNKNALKVINDAELVEGTFTHYGMHAAGVIISDNSDVSDYIPLMWDEKNGVWKTQCDMVESESYGLLKMDFLGLNNLSIITETLRNIRKRTGISIDIERDIEIEADVLRMIYCTGQTNSIFQFESGGMKKMLRQFKPDTIDDILLLNAAYRPGPMQYLDKIVRVKHGLEPISYLVPELESILGNTYGSIIYQEQVMRICQDLAGYSLGGADMVRRYMSKKKKAKLEHEREAFINGEHSDERDITGCVANGIDADKANELFDQMMAFAAYAFNKSHACAYAFVSYYTAWLKYHYPVEYLCAVMNNVPLEKLPGLIDDCKKFGINVLPPNINESQTGFTMVGNDILFGLNSIKNVGDSATPIIEERNAHGKFVSLKDYLRRGHVKKDSTESLILAGALDMFGQNRFAMVKVLPEFTKYLKKINDKEDAIAKKTAELDELLAKEATMTEKEFAKKKASLEKSITNAKAAADEARADFNKLTVPVIPENKKERLTNEKELLGMYVSSHPLDEYQSGDKLGATAIADLAPSKEVTIFGIIKNVRKTTRKSDGKPMAFFKLEDRTAEVDINCFTKTYEQYGLLVEEDAVVKITGSCSEEESFFEDEDMVKKINVKTIEEVKPIRQSILIHVESVKEWVEIVYPLVKGFASSDGYTAVVHIGNTNTMQQTEFDVSYDILTNKVGINAKLLQ